jgi:glycosyltransferase involved in cell wall biosynthesis
VHRDLVCFSHLRWDFVYQRPNHLMARAAKDRRVFFVEEPTFGEPGPARWSTAVWDGVTVATPRLPDGLDGDALCRALASLVDGLFREQGIRRPVLWYYTPMALPWTRQLNAAATIFDSMDHLAGFRGAPPDLIELEAELVERADLVFCGGASLHERMRHRHPASHPFPSSVDVAHFRGARRAVADPEDQVSIARPRIGYAGVIDERIDRDLIAGVAVARPDWQLVLLGPVVKIEESELPRRPNIHYLGLKSYTELPTYLGGWNVGWMPFARNEATRYISPTKTPEYLAAGLPVVSTSIRDVVEPYGTQGLVAIADSVETTLHAIESALAGSVAGLERADAFLATRSWDRTWAAMSALVDRVEGMRRPDVGRPRDSLPVGYGSVSLGQSRPTASARPTGVGGYGVPASAGRGVEGG